VERWLKVLMDNTVGPYHSGHISAIPDNAHNMRMNVHEYATTSWCGAALVSEGRTAQAQHKQLVTSFH